MTRTLFIDPVGGAAGDMILAALLDAGAPADALAATVDTLGLAGVTLHDEMVERGGLRARHLAVVTAARTEDRLATELRAVIADSRLTPTVRDRSLAVIDRLIAAEARVHGVAPGAVVLHELGGDDTLVDVCGVVALLDALGVERVVCGPMPLGGGVVETAHGPVPAPAPATFELLAGLPVFGVDVGLETVTPTGAAILATLADAFGPVPPMRIDATGVGAGSASIDGRPNVVRVLLGTATQTSPADDQVVVLEANVDDMIPELVPDVLTACLEAGAIDAWAQPIHMKKARPGLLLAVLAKPEDERTLAEVLLRHATTLGVRVQPATRHVADRATREVVVDGHVVRVKLGMLRGQVINIAPEHDDCSLVADATGRPVKQIWAEALAAAVSAARAEAGEGADALPR